MDVTVVESLWGMHALKDGEIYHWQCGSLAILFQRKVQEFWLTSVPDAVEGVLPSDRDLLWSRWASKQGVKQIKITPVFPDRPVVVRPEHPFKILVQASARIYLQVPVWVQVSLPSRQEEPLIEIPTVPLSKTWFGEYDEGEHCYWISSSARRDAPTEVPVPYLAICPLDISNKAYEDLLIDRICHRVGSLSLYAQGDNLWSNETKVSFYGGNDISQIKTRSGSPKEAEGATLLSSARVPARSGFRAKTFRALQNIGGAGIKLIEDMK